MGRKGKKSQRGVGEIDSKPRDKSLFLKITQEDYLILCAAAQHEQCSKASILIKLIRKHLSKYARYVASLEDEL